MTQRQPNKLPWILRIRAKVEERIESDATLVALGELDGEVAEGERSFVAER